MERIVRWKHTVLAHLVHLFNEVGKHGTVLAAIALNEQVDICRSCCGTVGLYARIVLRECGEERLQEMPNGMRCDVRGVCSGILGLAREGTVEKSVWREAARNRCWRNIGVVDQVVRKVGGGVVGESDLNGLVDEQNVRAPIPSPRAVLRAIAPIGQLHHFTRSILLEQAKHAAGAGTAIEPYCERRSLRRLPSLDEPEEGVDGIVLLDGSKCIRRKRDVARVLLLRIEYGGASAIFRLFV